MKEFEVKFDIVMKRSIIVNAENKEDAIERVDDWNDLTEEEKNTIEDLDLLQGGEQKIIEAVEVV